MSAQPMRDPKVNERLEKLRALFDEARKAAVPQQEVIRHLMKYGVRKDAKA